MTAPLTTSTPDAAAGTPTPAAAMPGHAALGVQMLHDRILVKPSPQSERTSRGGIVIPATTTVAKRLAWGEVAAAGNLVRSVKAGEMVLFNPEELSEVELGGDIYVVLRERDLDAVASERNAGGTGLYL